jgi:hypothetical protein
MSDRHVRRRGHVHALTTRARLGATLLGVCLLAAARPASARERLAVLVVAEQEPALADDLTEVVIADLAEHGDRELVGMRELRSRLGDVLPAAGLGACVDDPDCLARLGAAAAATLAVIAKVTARDGGYHLELALTEMTSAKIEAQMSTDVPHGFDELVAALRAGVRELFPVRPEAPRLAPVPAAPASAAAAGPTLSLVAREPGPPRTRRWAPYAGAVATGLAAVAFSAAAVTGTIAMQEPSGTTRAMAQADLDRRQGYATFANGMLATGTVLAVAASAAFAWWWRGGRGH